jgi:hypothetical protein
MRILSGVFHYGVVTDDASRGGEQWQREDHDPVSPVLHRDLDVIKPMLGQGISFNNF